MRKDSTLTRLILAGGLACLLQLAPCAARQAGPAPPRADEAGAARVSLSDAADLLDKIKEVESPTSRAYLYARVAAWLGRHAGEDPAVRRAAVEAAAAGVSDLHRHELEIPAAPAHMLYHGLLAVVSRHDPPLAEELKRTLPLRREAEVTDEVRASRAFHEATTKLADPSTASQGAEVAERLIAAGGVPPLVLQGEFMRLDASKSPALPRLLAAALALEEQRPGALPLGTLFFLSHIYLKDESPASLQTRFLAAALRASRVTPAEVKADPPKFSWAVPLLQRALPAMQRLTPDLHAEAAARLAALAPGAPAEDSVYARARKSSDPVGHLSAEAEAARDVRRKSELLEAAARTAREQGKLRLAAELMAAAEAARPTPAEGHQYRDEFLEGVVREAVARKDLDAAGFAASKVKSPVARAEALRPIARLHLKSSDPQSALRTLGEAEKLLETAPGGMERAVAYLHLADDFVGLDEARAAGAAREAVKAANAHARPAGVSEADYSWRLFPLAEAVTKTFRSLARAGRDGALAAAQGFHHRELRIAAALGVYGPEPR